MERGEKLTIDFEKYDLTEEEKELCRKYVKSDQNIEDLKKQRDKLEKENKGKEGERIRPIPLYEEIIFDFSA